MVENAAHALVMGASGYYLMILLTSWELDFFGT
jgi:hypothetical protein